MEKSVAIFPLIFAGLFTAAAAYDLSPPEESWVEKSDKGEFKTYARDVEDSDTSEVMMIGVMNEPPAKCFAVVGDYGAFPEFMPYIEFSKVIHSEKIGDGKTVNHVFFYLSPPLVSSRFYTLKLTDEENADDRAGTFRSQWRLDDGSGESSFRRTPDAPEFGGKLKSAVETTFNSGYWQFEPLEDGKKTKVTYYVWTNPGGSIPSWIANKGNTVALPNLWEAVKKRLKNTKYKG